MKILKGMFRLSIVAAVLVGIYLLVDGHLNGMNADRENTRIWTTLRCGEKFLSRDMSAYRNDVGLIDIGKAGCGTSGRFLATFDEIRDALKNDQPESMYWHYIMLDNIGIMMSLTFIAVNLVGLLLWGLVRTVSWVRDGFA